MHWISVRFYEMGDLCTEYKISQTIGDIADILFEDGTTNEGFIFVLKRYAMLFLINFYKDDAFIKTICLYMPKMTKHSYTINFSKIK